MEKIRIAILVVSDSCSEGTLQDASGHALRGAIFSVDNPRFESTVYKVVPDDRKEIERALRELSSSVSDALVVITVGGTGFSPRDVTPEATKNVIEKEANGIVIALITASLPAGAYSRLVAGVRNKTLIVNFPGSTKAVTECWNVLCPLLPHIVDLLADRKYEADHFHCEIRGTCAPTPDSQSDGSSGSGLRPADSKAPLHGALKIIYGQIDAEERAGIFLPVRHAYGYVLKKDVFLCPSSHSEPSGEASSLKDPSESVFHVTVEEFRPAVKDQISLMAGSRIRHCEIGLMQGMGINKVSVVEKPLVAIISVDGALGQFIPSSREVQEETKCIMTGVLKDHHFDLDDAGDMSVGVSNSLRKAFEKVDYLICLCGELAGHREVVISALKEDLRFSAHFDGVVMGPKGTVCFMTGSMYGKRKFFFCFFSIPHWAAAYMILIPALFHAEDSRAEPFPVVSVKVADSYDLAPYPQYVRAFYASAGDVNVRLAKSETETHLSTSAIHPRASFILMLPPETESCKKIRKGDTADAFVIAVS